ncbi:MAG TPA: efflux RND transporter periplasmic adaptor subunit [Chromatiales bacterium]|nr:efflux RND transporter periplasmic adaptor subunit [Chromatiales bacterium]
MGRLLLLISLLLFAGGCAERPTAKPQKRPPQDHLVEIQTLQTRPTRIAYERPGTLKLRRSVRIYNREEGAITALPFYEGDRVKKGETVLRIDADLLQLELAKARATTRQAQVDLRRVRNLLAKNAASEDEVAQARTALEIAQADQRLLEKRLQYTIVRSPFDAVVSERLAEPGNLVAKHTHILTLGDPASLIAELNLSELLLARLRTGDAVEVRIDALDGRPFPGRIRRIHPQLDPRTRMGIVEIAFDSIPPGARAGQFCRVTVKTAEQALLVIPFSALQRDRKEEFVYLYDADAGMARRTTVRSGERIADQVEIIEGLQPGQALIVRGFLGLRDGKQVKPLHDSAKDTAG